MESGEEEEILHRRHGPAGSSKRGRDWANLLLLEVNGEGPPLDGERIGHRGLAQVEEQRQGQLGTATQESSPRAQRASRGVQCCPEEQVQPWLAAPLHSHPSCQHIWTSPPAAGDHRAFCTHPQPPEGTCLLRSSCRVGGQLHRDRDLGWHRRVWRGRDTRGVLSPAPPQAGEAQLGPS